MVSLPQYSNELGRFTVTIQTPKFTRQEEEEFTEPYVNRGVLREQVFSSKTIAPL
jgi:hypothetical protein